jgi:hypothetical protein
LGEIISEKAILLSLMKKDKKVCDLIEVGRGRAKREIIFSCGSILFNSASYKQ